MVVPDFIREQDKQQFSLVPACFQASLFGAHVSRLRAEDLLPNKTHQGCHENLDKERALCYS